jgi:hypothetical protein
MARNLDTPTTLVVAGLIRRARAAAQAETTDLDDD